MKTIMMTKQFHLFSLLLLLAASLAACSSDSFKIDGDISNLDGTSVRVIFQGDSGIVDELVDVDKKGRFSYKGSATQPTILTVNDHRGNLLTMMVVTDGDHLKIKGDAGKALGIKVKGNRLNEEWQLFRDEHAAFYSDPNPSRLDATIEKYVREHPADVLSTVLLIADYSDYSDRDKVLKMLHSIDLKARPNSLARTIDGKTVSKKNLPRLLSLVLAEQGGGFEDVDLTGHTTLLSLWCGPQPDRSGLATRLQDIGQHVRIIDILTESDTLRWHQTIAADPAGWRHYWAPAGPLEPGIQLLGITSMPWYAVADSTGLVLYSGPDLSAAIARSK